MVAIDNLQIYLKVLERKDLYLFKKGNSSVTRFFRVTSKHKSPPPWLAFPHLFGPRPAGNDRSFDNKFSPRDILSQFPHSNKSKWLEFTILHKLYLPTCFFLDEFISSNHTLSISALHIVIMIIHSSKDFNRSICVWIALVKMTFVIRIRRRKCRPDLAPADYNVEYIFNQRPGELTKSN